MNQDSERLWRLVGRLEVILGLHVGPEVKLEKIVAVLNGLPRDGGHRAGEPVAPTTCPRCGELLARRDDGTYEHDLVPPCGHPCHPGGPNRTSEARRGW